MSEDIGKGRWALILGASSGFGEACARSLADAGYNIFGVHLDRRAGLEHVKLLKAELEATGQRAHFFNINAADPEKMEDVLEEMKGLLGLKRRSVSSCTLWHSARSDLTWAMAPFLQARWT